MPAHYVLDIEKRIVLTVFRGVLTLLEAVEQRDRLHDDTAFDPDFSEIVDFNTDGFISLAALRCLADQKPIWTSDTPLK
jgi:hypothetical protein